MNQKISVKVILKFPWTSNHVISNCARLFFRVPFLDHTVTCEEKRTLRQSTKLISMGGRSRRCFKAFLKACRAPKKGLSDSAVGLIHYGFLSQGETITAKKCYKELDKMNQKLLQIHPDTEWQRCKPAPWQRPTARLTGDNKKSWEGIWMRLSTILHNRQSSLLQSAISWSISTQEMLSKPSRFKKRDLPISSLPHLQDFTL